MGGWPVVEKVGAGRVTVPTELGVGMAEPTSVVKDEGGLQANCCQPRKF